MKNMLRQPTWHRGWREFLCECAVRFGRKVPDSPAIFRVGIIAAGRVARRHVYGYRKTGKAIIAATAEPDVYSDFREKR